MSGGFNTSLGLCNPQNFGANLTAGNYGGTALTNPTVINTKGAWKQIGANTNYDSTAIQLYALYTSGTSGAQDYAGQLDIGIGPSGSQQVVISNVNFCSGNSTSAASAFDFTNVFLPLSIPANNAIWARWSANYATPSGAMYVKCATYDSQYAGAPTITKYDDYGTISTGRGSVIVGGSGAMGSWSQLGSSNTSADYFGFWLRLDQALVSGSGQDEWFVLNIGVGSSGSQQIIVPNWVTTTQQYTTLSSPYFETYIPANTAIWAQAAALNGSSSNCGITLYGAR